MPASPSVYNAPSATESPFIVVPPIWSGSGDDNRRMIYIRVGDIIIDQNVQRNVNPDKLTKMGEFDYDLAETPTLVERTDGAFVAIEGQHRTELLRSENPDAHLWCNLLAGPVDEAGIALAITKSRKAHSPYEAFGLEVAKGDEYAIAVQDALETVGVQLSNYKRQIPGNQRIAAVAAVRNAVRLSGRTPGEGREFLTTVLSILRVGFGEQTDMWASLLIKSVAQILDRNQGQVNTERLTATLARQAPARWLQETSHKREGQPALECVATAIIQEYNRGLHQQNRIEW